MFRFTEDQLSLQEMMRDFAAAKLAPIAEECDQTSKFPKEFIDELTELGIFSLNIPEQYGGGGMDNVSSVIAISELSYASAGITEVFSTQILVTDIINMNANEEQKKKYLGWASEGKVGAFALTEPGAGSDAGGLRTKAVKDGDEWVINGNKCFISNMGPDEGDFAIVIALTDPEKGTRGGMTAFLVDRGTPGFSVGKLEDKLGIRAAAVSELIFEDCRVPESQMLGKVGDGFKIAMSGLDGGRIAIAALSLGIAKAALDEATKYSKERSQFGKPICKNQGLQWYMADMATQYEAAKLLTYRAAAARDENDPKTPLYASMAKYYASEAAGKIADMALQIHGGYGFMKDYAIERIYRDARILRIFEGTSEIQKMVISREILK